VAVDPKAISGLASMLPSLLGNKATPASKKKPPKVDLPRPIHRGPQASVWDRNPAAIEAFKSSMESGTPAQDLRTRVGKKMGDFPTYQVPKDEDVVSRVENITGVKRKGAVALHTADESIEQYRVNWRPMGGRLGAKISRRNPEVYHIAEGPAGAGAEGLLPSSARQVARGLRSRKSRFGY